VKNNLNDPIEKLFFSPELVKVLRQLVFNPDDRYTKSDLTQSLKINKRTLTKVLKVLEESEVIKTSRRGRDVRYSADRKNDSLITLQKLLRYDYESNKRLLKKLFKKTGSISQVILTGQFTENDRSPVDVVIIAKKYDEKGLSESIQQLGYKTGFEPRYLVLDPDDFAYRQEMNDRVVRNVIDFDHIQLF
jgi:DNA-binding transcriptional ArsR family regulator